jgi:hypothetical protein
MVQASTHCAKRPKLRDIAHEKSTKEPKLQDIAHENPDKETEMHTSYQCPSLVFIVEVVLENPEKCFGVCANTVENNKCSEYVLCFNKETFRIMCLAITHVYDQRGDGTNYYVGHCIEYFNDYSQVPNLNIFDKRDYNYTEHNSREYFEERCRRRGIVCN